MNWLNQKYSKASKKAISSEIWASTGILAFYEKKYLRFV